MEKQNYDNHRRLVTGYHFVLFGILLLTLIGSLINVWKAIGDHSRLYNAALLVVMVGCVIMTTFYARIFALVAQDRAIRSEEKLRHHLLTGELLDDRLTTRQIVALRFASDEEFPALAKIAAEEKLGGEAIKKAIKIWRADEYRV